MYYNFFDLISLEIDSKDIRWHERLNGKYLLFRSEDQSSRSYNWHIRLYEKSDSIDSHQLYLGEDWAFTEGSLYRFDYRGYSVKIEGSIYDTQVQLRADVNVDLTLLENLVEDIIFFKCVQAGVLPVHSCSFQFGGLGILCPAWAATGKTRLVLKVLEQGGVIISDEWSLIFDGKVYPMSKRLLLMYYDILSFSRLTGTNYYDLIRAKLFYWSKIDILSRILERMKLSLRYKLVDMTSLCPQFGRPVLLDKIICLQSSNVSEPTIENYSTNEMITFILACFTRERRSLFDLLSRADLSDSRGFNSYEWFVRRYKKLSFSLLNQPCKRLIVPKGKFDNDILDMVVL